MPKRIEKPIGMSRQDVDRLPPLVTLKVFLFATGLDKNLIKPMVDDGDIKRLPVGPSRTRHRYYKADIMRICGYIRTEVKHGN